MYLNTVNLRLQALGVAFFDGLIYTGGGGVLYGLHFVLSRDYYLKTLVYTIWNGWCVSENGGLIIHARVSLYSGWPTLYLEWFERY